MQERRALVFPGLRSGHLPLPAALALALLVALTPQQLPVNLGDFLQVIFDLVIVLDPTPDFSYLLRRNDSPGRPPGPQRDCQIPHRSMPFALGAFARRISAGYIPLDQGSPQYVGDRGKLFGQTLPTPAQGQFGKPAESVTCLHLSASLHQNRRSAPDANPPACESPPIPLIQKGIKLLCEVPGISVGRRVPKP